MNSELRMDSKKNLEEFSSEQKQFESKKTKCGLSFVLESCIIVGLATLSSSRKNARRPGNQPRLRASSPAAPLSGLDRARLQRHGGGNAITPFLRGLWGNGGAPGNRTRRQRVQSPRRYPIRAPTVWPPCPAATGCGGSFISQENGTRSWGQVARPPTTRGGLTFRGVFGIQTAQTLTRFGSNSSQIRTGFGQLR